MTKKRDVLLSIQETNKVVESYLKRRQQITDSTDKDPEIEKQLKHNFDILLDNMKQSFMPGISGIPCRYCKGSGVES